MAVETGRLCARRLEAWPNRNVRRRQDEPPRFLDKACCFDRSTFLKALRQLKRKLQRIGGANSADHTQGPANEVVCFARTILLIVESQRIAGRCELRHEPIGVKQ